MQSYSAESERELFPLSWLTQYGYCPRRCGLMALEQLWTESADTAAGRAQHERVHTARIERRSGQMNLYELPVFSRSLGVNGKCDCVEALETPDGVELPYGQNRYRRCIRWNISTAWSGTRKNTKFSSAPRRCVEEQFDCIIPAGAISISMRTAGMRWH